MHGRLDFGVELLAGPRDEHTFRGFLLAFEVRQRDLSGGFTPKIRTLSL